MRVSPFCDVRHCLPPIRFYIFSFLHALGITACRAVVAAFGVDEHVGAFRALSRQVFSQTVIIHPGGVFVINDVLFQYAGNGVGTRKDRFAFVPGDRRAADAA
jgi:hypothetical protein